MSTSIVSGAGRLAFEISPIIFTNGIAGNSYGALPIVAVTQQAGAARNGVLNGEIATSLDEYFAHFSPVPGGKLANFSFGQFPFANQQVAANAVIFEPLTIALKMSIPVQQTSGYVTKFLTMLALQSILRQHAQLGGTYTIVTPAGIWPNCLLASLTDISQGASPAPQNTWQWDFIQPLITLQQAQGAQNTFMSNYSAGVQMSGSLAAPGNTSALPNIFSDAATTGTNIPGGILGTILGGSSAPTPTLTGAA